jgi:starch synthase
MNMKTKEILMVTSELVGFAKTGGLADVPPALAKILAKHGYKVKIVMPRYKCIDRSKLTLYGDGVLEVQMGGSGESCVVYTCNLPDTPKENPVQIFFIDHEAYFGNRDGLYGTPKEPDFHDNARRFGFFCKTVFELCRKLNWYPDILHAHDWQAAMAPVYLKFAERKGGFSKTVSVLTIHNLGYQGIYSREDFDYFGLDEGAFCEAGFGHCAKQMNLLKAGLHSADALNTVSSRYAEETKTADYGCGLDSVLRARAADYLGILNGIDTETWSPSTDSFLTIDTRYSAQDMSGKARAKEALQKAFGLPVNDKVPLIGMITRLTDQKGVRGLFDHQNGSVWQIFHDMEVQMVVLGTGDTWCENEVRLLDSKLINFKAKIGYDEKLAHLIEAGSDLYLMPSEYEPCGLNQMYSLNFGSLPIVRNTGGLADSVQNYNQYTGEGTGFMFDDITPSAIYNTVGWAVWAWYNCRNHIEAMRLRAMKQNFSWEKSAKKYADLYDCAKRKIA